MPTNIDHNNNECLYHSCELRFRSLENMHGIDVVKSSCRMTCIHTCHVFNCKKKLLQLPMRTGVIVTRLVSAAGTGYYHTIKNPRAREKMMLRKYDPKGKQIYIYILIIMHMIIRLV